MQAEYQYLVTQHKSQKPIAQYSPNIKKSWSHGLTTLKASAVPKKEEEQHNRIEMLDVWISFVEGP